jgi:16S rRNA (uracil1498-N3)-methyltransferase
VSAPLVYVDDLASPVLTTADRHHLERALRLRPGDEIIVADGRGAWRSARLAPVIEPIGAVMFDPETTPAITVVFAPVKGDRPEWMVAKLTELGVDVIVPMTTARSVVRWPADHDLDRLRRVIREAGMQCRRPRLPQLRQPVTFAEAAAFPGACLADMVGAAPSLVTPTILIGPEGGWTDDERSMAIPSVRLGNHTLRAETAGVAAAVIWGVLRLGLVGQHPS